MNPDHYTLVPFGNYMNKLGYIILVIVVIWALVGLIVGSSFTHDMYIYNDEGYRQCVQYNGIIGGHKIDLNDEGMTKDSLARTQE